MNEDDKKHVVKKISEEEAGKDRKILVLQLSRNNFDEIRDAIENAGYDDLLMKDNLISLNGVCVAGPPSPDNVDIFINSQPFSVPYGNGEISYEEIRELIYPDSRDNFYPSCMWNDSFSGMSGNLWKGKTIKLVPNLKINMIDTSNA